MRLRDLGGPDAGHTAVNVLNAIAKVRFNSARPQRVQLSRGSPAASDLLCLEPGQKLPATGRCVYYVIAGTGQLTCAAQKSALAMGSFAAIDDGQSHTLTNTSEQRLICLAVRQR